jgi:hypothetical protein
MDTPDCYYGYVDYDYDDDDWLSSPTLMFRGFIDNLIIGHFSVFVGTEGPLLSSQNPTTGTVLMQSNQFHVLEPYLFKIF